MMRFGINLRGDLAKLSDEEIGAKYEALISDIERLVQSTREGARRKPFYLAAMASFGWRGLLHAPIFYKMQAVVFGCLHVLQGNSSINRNGIELYLLDCEFKDTRDEIKRRVRRRQLAAA
jgi:hypothetical protein